MSIVLDAGSRILVQGITGWQARSHLPHMLAYGSNVIAGVSPGKGGQVVSNISVFDTIEEVLDRCGPVDLSVLFVPGPAVLDASLEAIDAGIPWLVVLAEGVPFRDTIELLEHARERGTRVIGPNSQGIITPGEAKVGGTGGDDPARMFLPGRVGVVSRSGGMGAETCWLLSRNGIGQSTYLAVGGEFLNGTSLLEAAQLFEQDPGTDVIVCFGEPGTGQEEKLAQAVAAQDVTKPLIAHVPGDFVESRPSGMSFGHAGAVIEGQVGAPSAKRALLRDAGVTVAERWSDIPAMVQSAIDSQRPPAELPARHN